MKISSIEKQRKKGRYNIFFDGEFAFGAYEDTIVKFGLRKGDDLSEEKIVEIRDYDEFNYGKNAAYRLLSYRQRSEKEIIRKLKEKKIRTGIIEKVLEKLKELKFLDDGGFAKSFVIDQISKKSGGKRLLSQKLFQKGIDRKTIESAIKENFSVDKELESAEIILKKYFKKVRGKNDADKKRKCYSYLLSKGFSYDIANEAFKNCFSSYPSETPEQS